MRKIKRYPNPNTIAAEIKTSLRAYPLELDNRAVWKMGNQQECRLELFPHPAFLEPLILLNEIEPNYGRDMPRRTGINFVLNSSGVLEKVFGVELVAVDNHIETLEQLAVSTYLQVQAAIDLSYGVNTHILTPR